jgi:hypothetical protein
MGIDDAESLVLLLQIDDQSRQYGMLQDIGEIARVIDVPVIHSAPRSVS